MIKHYSFTGQSPALALQKAKEELGEDLTLEATKQIRPKTINQKPIYEVIVGREEQDNASFSSNQEEEINSIKRQIEAYTNLGKKQAQLGTNANEERLASATKAINKPAAKAFKDQNNEQSDEDISLSFSKTAEKIAELANIQSSQASDYGQKLRDEKMRDIEKKLDKLGDRISLIADTMWQSSAASRADINIPPEFATIYKRAASSGMKSEHLKAIMEATIANMPTKMKSNPSAIERYFYFLLEKMLPRQKAPDMGRKQRIMMLVGPTGVGKTTTLSKLAYKYAYDNPVRLKTGVITLDSYRIGAVEQLAQYTQVMRMRMIEAINIDEFKAALKQLSSCDLVLVDTVGSSQYDTQKLANLSNFLVGSGAQIDVQLVLSANTKVEDLLQSYKNFSFANIDSLIITKLDETKIFGNVFSLVYETNTPVSFFSVGQNVPDDIEVADNVRLVKCVLEGFGDGPSK